MPQTLKEIRDSRLKRENALAPVSTKPTSSVIGEAGNAFDLSVNKGISTNEATSELAVQSLLDSVKQFDDSPIFQGVDALVDIFDPSEPPDPSIEPGNDPLGDLARAELAMLKPVAKVTMKLLTAIGTPVDRAFKFTTNALMFDPLTKSATGPMKKFALNAAIESEVADRFQLFLDSEGIKQGDIARMSPTAHAKFSADSKEAMLKIRDEVNIDASDTIKRVNSEVEELEPVKISDFGASLTDALKSTIPWPGAADDVKTFGEIGADSFERIVGREAPWYYAPVSDLAVETIATTGILRVAATSQSAVLSKDAATISRAAKLTKTEINAMRKARGTASQVKKVPIASNTVPNTVEASNVSQKLIKLLKEAKPLRDKKALLLHQDRQRKSAKLAVVQKNVSGRKLVRSTKGALKGKAPVPDFQPIDADLLPSEVDALFNLVNTSKLSDTFDKGRAFISLDELLKGNIITKSEVKNLEVVFGKQFAQALAKKRSVGSIAQDLVYETINLPRAMLASYDLSAGGRQGVIFSVSHPVASTKAYGRSVKAAFNAKYADDLEKATRLNKSGQLADAFGVHSTPFGSSAKTGASAENYLSNIAEKIPGIAQSERAFVTFLNQQRREVFSLQAKKWIKRGVTPENNPKVFKQYAQFVNHATGRGTMEGLDPSVLTSMNALFFSPRFQVSRVQVVGDLIDPRTTALARKAIARDLSEFYATGMGILAMAEMGGAEVEKDPRSSDFGKVKVGNTRYNYWGAFQPLASLAGRVYSGEIKTTGIGKIKDKTRFNIVTNFLRTKLSPVAGSSIDAIVGETSDGTPVEFTKDFVGQAAFKSLTPLVIQDIADAWKFQEHDAQFPISAGLAFNGIGVQTWEIAPFAQLELEKDSLSRQTFGKNYDQLNFYEVKFLDTDILVNHPGIIDLERQTKFESQGVNFLKKQALEMRKSEQFLNSKVDTNLLADMDTMKIRLGGVSRVVGNWRLNNEQYKEYQDLVAKNINILFKENKQLWDSKSSNMTGKFEVMSAILRNAKLLSANEMKIGSME